MTSFDDHRRHPRTTDGAPPSGETSATAPRAADLLDVFAPTSAAAARIYPTTTELAAASTLVATGRFERFQPGRARVRISDGQAGGTSTVMVLSQTTIVQGQHAAASEGMLYLEVPIGGEDAMDHQTAAAILAGADVLVYAATAWDGSATINGYRAVDPDAGRPAGQPMYRVGKPQGIAIQAAGDVVVWPALHRSAPGTLAQGLPGGDLIWTA